MLKALRKRIDAFVAEKSKKNLAVRELADMTMFYLVLVISVTVYALVYFCLSGRADFRIFTGVAAGTAVSVLNLYGIGLTAHMVIRRRKVKKAQFISNFSYGIRYVGMVAIFMLLIALDLVNMITLFLPLFVPKVYYFWKYTLNKVKEN